MSDSTKVILFPFLLTTVTIWAHYDTCHSSYICKRDSLEFYEDVLRHVV